MKTLIVIVMFFASCMAVAQFAPVVKNIQDGNAQKVAAAKYKEESHKKASELCASGKGNAIIYNGIRCNNY